MLSVSTHRYFRLLLELAVFALVTFGIIALFSVVSAQTPARNAPAALPATQEAPVFRDYRGVRLGMNMTEVRQRLGTPADAQGRQDFYVFSDKESVQVFYDAQNSVSGLSINYLGEGSGAPAPEQVLGVQAPPNPDGSIYKLVRYETARFWVAYSRTAGEQPLVTIAVQTILR